MLRMNKRLAAARLNSTVKTHERMGRPEEYHEIMREQIMNEIIQPCASPSDGGGRALRISFSGHLGRYWNDQNENHL